MSALGKEYERNEFGRIETIERWNVAFHGVFDGQGLAIQ